MERQFKTLEMSFHIFTANHDELVRLLSLYRDPKFALDRWVRRENQQFLTDVMGRLHNYVAAAKTLVEHTRIQMRASYDEKELAEYEAKVQEFFGSSDLSHFVQELRNYFLHRGIPVTSAQIRGGATGAVEAGEISINVAKLLPWDGWRTEARRHLESMEEDEPLLSIIEAYTGIVQRFFDWLGEWQTALHKHELDELNAMVTRANELEALLFPKMPEEP